MFFCDIKQMHKGIFVLSSKEAFAKLIRSINPLNLIFKKRL